MRLALDGHKIISNSPFSQIIVKKKLLFFLISYHSDSSRGFRWRICTSPLQYITNKRRQISIR